MNEPDDQTAEPGRRDDVMLYTLSTCVWCHKTKELLKQLSVDFHNIDVDLVPEVEKEQIMDEVKKWNPEITFPTMVIHDQKCIVGYREDEIREALGK